MFLKPFKAKSQSAIKGSDRKKLRAQINNQFSDMTQQMLLELVPNKDEMTVSKLQLHDEKTVITYQLLKNPIFIDSDGKLYPTVYTLWKYPELLPTMKTHTQVFPKLCNGADLMLPGVITEGDVTPKTFQHFQKGDMCAITLLGNKSPVAVGEVAMGGDDMYLSAMRGKAVTIIHFYKDQLWASGDKSEPPLVDEVVPVSSDEESEDNTIEPDKSQASGLSEESKVQEPQEATTTETMETGAEGLSDDDENLAEAVSAKLRLSQNQTSDRIPPSQGSEGSTKNEMDSRLYQCFLCALKSSVKKKDLPLLTSNFYRLHILPFCPANEHLDVKKSSYKKLGKFLQTMKERGFITVKEFPKGVENITDVDFSHAEIRSFDASLFTKQDVVTTSENSCKPETDHLPVVTEVFLVTAPTLLFFNMFGFSKGTPLTKPLIKSKIVEYVRLNQLQTVDQKQKVTLDETLSTVLQCGKHDSCVSLAWEDILTRLVSKMSPAFQITRQGEQPVIKKGRLEPVSFSVAQRAANKKVTLIHNLELYGISPAEFAHQVQVGCACSTSVTELPGKGTEVLVQGNQVNFVAKLLFEKYKLPRKSVQGLELAPKPKKKR